ncbi:MAG: methyl-accepting chemotaxis protein [Candidatus Polarisedimenticolaceae bacterium]|nr:methyl-accepting chemotaxis protein [Candidatus Polarisedimenticolaceae bacterium]
MKSLLNKISIRAKIIGNAVIALLLLLGSTLFALNSMSQIGHELEGVVDRDIAAMNALIQINEHAMQQSIHFERALRYGKIIDQVANAKSRLDEEAVLFNKLNSLIHQEASVAITLFDNAHAKADTEEAKAEFEHLAAAMKKIIQEHKFYVKHANEVFEIFAAGEAHKAEALAKKTEHEADKVDHAISVLLNEIEVFTEQAGHIAVEHELQAANTLGVILLLAIIISGATSWLVSSEINYRLRRASDNLSVIASGDLTQGIEVDGNDEITALTQSAKVMHERLVEMISEISATSQQLATASEEVSVISTQTNNNIQAQQDEISQVATAMTEMSATVNEVAHNIENTATAAHEASIETGEGKKQVELATHSIQDLSCQIDDASSVVREVEEASKNINSVLDVIVGIAEQTNLLALNAAIEAARAGEQGRGFAVVADEVRTLAGRTQQSTEEINKMIDQLQTGSRNAVKAMESSANRAQSVVEQSNQASKSLVTITEAVSRINEMSTQIASAAEEQSAVSEEINQNLIKISTMAEENSNGAQESATAGHSMAEMATRLQDLISQFRVT